MPRGLGITSLQILAAIRDGSAYGLELIAATGLPSGTVYPTLGRLRSRGLIRSRWEDQRVADREGRPRRRYYELSPEGARALTEGLERIQAVAADLRPGAAGGSP
jgi:PadR family transcriptional regulator PadR